MSGITEAQALEALHQLGAKRVTIHYDSGFFDVFFSAPIAPADAYWEAEMAEMVDIERIRGEEMTAKFKAKFPDVAFSMGF